MRAVLFFIALVVCDFNPKESIGISDLETTLVAAFFMFLLMDIYELITKRI